MLCTFTTEDGTLVIRSDDIRVIENAGPERSRLIFMERTATVSSRKNST